MWSPNDIKIDRKRDYPNTIKKQIECRNLDKLMFIRGQIVKKINNIFESKISWEVLTKIRGKLYDALEMIDCSINDTITQGK